MPNSLEIQLGDNYGFTIISHSDLDSVTNHELFRITSDDRIHHNLKKHGFCYDEACLYWNKNKIDLPLVIKFLKGQEKDSPTAFNILNMVISYIRSEKLENLLTNTKKII